MIVMNYNPEDIVDKQHICYYTKESIHGKLELREMFEYTIKHPEAPEHAFVKKIDYEILKRIPRTDNSEGSAHIHLMDYAQKICINTIKLENLDID